jgi:hypothetical protein
MTRPPGLVRPAGRRTYWTGVGVGIGLGLGEGFGGGGAGFVATSRSDVPKTSGPVRS